MRQIVRLRCGLEASQAMLLQGKRAVLGMLFLGGLLLPSGAAALTITLGTVFNGDSPASTAPYLTADFQTVAPGQVTLTLTSSLDVASEYIHEVGFNIDPNILPSSITVTQSSGPTAVAMSGAQDAQVMTGTGVVGFGFDFLLEFPTTPPGDRFDDSLVAEFTLTGGAITDSSFNFVNANNGVIVGAHIHGIACTPTSQSSDCFDEFGNFLPTGTASGAISQVPEAGTAVLIGSGLIGLAYVGRRRS